MEEEQVTSGDEQTMREAISVKEAVKHARDYLLDLYEDQSLPNLRLEEVELSTSKNEWLITFGFTPQEYERGAFRLHHPETLRDYKVIRVDARTGELRSMKIRSVERVS